MTLINFKVLADPEANFSVAITADDEKERVVGFVGRAGLEDYFPARKLTGQNRFDLVDSNLPAFQTILARKYEQGEWTEEGRFGSTIRRIDIALSDLRAGPPLNDVRLQVQEKAGFQSGGR